jgi:hypothetical protein
MISDGNNNFDEIASLCMFGNPLHPVLRDDAWNLLIRTPTDSNMI